MAEEKESNAYVVPERIEEARAVLRDMVKTRQKTSNMPAPFHTHLAIIENNIGGFFMVPAPDDL